MAKKEKEKIGEVTAVEVVKRPSVHELAKVEIDSQVATARKFPRDIEVFKVQLHKLATATEEIAASCFYKIPREGKHIEGASIRMAEIAAGCYRNILVQGDVSHEDGNFIYAVGMCRDLENNTGVRQTVRRRITKKDGTRFSDDMVAVTANAAVSIVIRNVLLRVIPRAYTDPILEECKKVAIGNAETMVNRRTKAIQYISKMGIGEDRILAVLKKNSVEEIDRKDLELLRGLINAIRDNEIEVDTAFPEPKPEQAPEDKLQASVADPEPPKKGGKKKKKKKKKKAKTNLF